MINNQMTKMKFDHCKTFIKEKACFATNTDYQIMKLLGKSILKVTINFTVDV